MWERVYGSRVQPMGRQMESPRARYSHAATHMGETTGRSLRIAAFLSLFFSVILFAAFMTRFICLLMVTFSARARRAALI